MPLDGVEWWGAFFTGVAATLTVVAVVIYFEVICRWVLSHLDHQPRETPLVALHRITRPTRGHDDA